MIVFKEDWRKYPGAIVDTKTPNKSFLDMAALLRDMGVDHYYFHLALLQPELQGVDPHSENLSPLEQSKILFECDNNPWYYLREIVIDHGSGIELDDKRFKANRSNIAAMWLLLASIDYIQIQPRQTGKSYGTDNNSLWLTYFCYKSTELNLITKDESLRKTNIARLKKLRDGWPNYLNRNTKKDDNNQISLSCIDRSNKYYTHVSQTSEKAANNLGRGMTSPFIHIDEGPFINHIETTVSAAMGSTNTAREIAKRKGVPYCTIFTTTAGNQEDRDGRYVYNLMNEAAVWTERFYDCKDRDSLAKLIRTNSTGRSVMVNLTMSALQLGFSKQWLYESIANARSEGDNIDRDYFNVWTSSSSASLIPQNLAKVIRASEMLPVDQWISKENYIFRWYEETDPSTQYVLNVDTSDAIGRDDIAITLLNSRTGATAGSATFNETNLMRFAQWLLEFMLKYKNSTLVIERRFNAQVIIDYLLLKLPTHGEDPFVRIFNQIVQKRDDRANDYHLISTTSVTRRQFIYDRYRRDFGFVTDSDTRKLLFNNVMMNAAKDVGGRVRDKTLIHQMLNLVIKNNRIDHKSSEHDDLVVSWLMGHWLLNYGINLSYYGFDSKQIMIDRGMNGKKLSSEEQLEKSEQDNLMAKIKDTHEQLKETSNQLDVIRLEMELSALLTKVKSTEDDGMTLDALLQEANEARDVRRKHKYGGRNSKASELLRYHS